MAREPAVIARSSTRAAFVRSALRARALAAGVAGLCCAPMSLPSTMPAAPSAPVPLIVHGARGRMGCRILSQALTQPALFRVIAGVDRSGGTLRELGLDSDAPIVTTLPAQVGAVIVDFSHPSAFPALARHCATHRLGLVSGTTGIAPEVLSAELAHTATASAVLHAMNMSIGVNVLFKVAAQIAKTLGTAYDIEIVEAHHNQKKDAPSGTAFGIADAILEATGRTRADLVHGRDGDVGARRPGEIGMHALRLGDVVGDHTVYFVGNGERLMLGHLAHTRDIFAGGALRAATFVANAKAGRYGMADVLGL